MKPEEFKPFLESGNIYFVPVDEEIDDRYLAWVNDRETIEHLETGKFPKTRTALTEYVKSVNESPDHAFFGVMTKNPVRYIGNVKLGPIDWINRTAEYGLMIGDKNARGKGYGVEIAGLTMHYAFMVLNLNKVTAGASVDNIASVKMHEKAGFKVEGKLKEQVFHNGSYRDTVRMGITKNQYLELYQDGK